MPRLVAWNSGTALVSLSTVVGGWAGPVGAGAVGLTLMVSLVLLVRAVLVRAA